MNNFYQPVDNSLAVKRKAKTKGIDGLVSGRFFRLLTSIVVINNGISC